MRRVLRAAAVTAALLSLAAACGLDDSEVIIGTTPGEGDASPDGTVADASRDATGDGTVFGDATISDSGSDATDTGVTDAESDAADASDADAEVDAGVDAGPCPTAIVCDGNPSACGIGQVCAPDVPSGWTLVGFDDPAQAASANPCGAVYAASSKIEVTDGGASADCTCSCTAGTPPSCTNANVVVFTGTSCATSDETVSETTGCTDLAPSFPVQNSNLLYELFPDPTTCAPNLGIDAGTWSEGNARECDVTGDAGALCASHATCITASGASHTACVAQAYAGALPPACGSSCPTGYQTSCFAVGSSVNDSRTCTGCSCGWSSPGCDSPAVTVYDTAGCTGASDSVSGTACSPATNVTSIASVGLTGTSSTTTCDVQTPASPSGTLTVGSEAIVCCAN